MDAVEIMRAYGQMCRMYEEDCTRCELSHFRNQTGKFCRHFVAECPEEAVEIVEKWTAEHPKKTRQSEFLKMFPNVPMENGFLLTNPCWVDSTVKCLKQKSDGVYEDAPERCVECRKEYWHEEVE